MTTAEKTIERTERNGRKVSLIRQIVADVKTSKPTKDTAKRSHAKKERLAYKYRDERLANRTPAELAFEEILRSLKIKFQPERVFFIKGDLFKIVDFYLPEYKAAVEIDGGYHFTGEQIINDQLRRKGLLNIGAIARMIRFSNEEILGRSTDEVCIKLLSSICPPVLTYFENEILRRLQGIEQGPQYGNF